MEGSPSRVLIEARMETKKALEELERTLPRRLVERRNVELGDPGRLSFTIDRGPFSFLLEGEELTVGVDLRGQAEVCKPVAFLGCVGYASCAPEGQARASLKLLLGEDYRLLPSRVQIPVTRPCTLSALGLDMTAEVQAQANRQADEIHQRIDGALPGLGDTIASVWRALSTTVALGNKACARIVPRGVLQTGPRLRDGWLSGALGIEGDIQVQSPCVASSPPPAMPRPRLVQEEPGVELHIPLVTSWDEVGLTLTRSLALAEPRVGGEIVHITEVRAGPGNDGKVRLLMTLAGRSCGQVALDAIAEARPDGLFLRALAPAPGEQERLGGVAFEGFGAPLEGRLRLPLPAEVSGMHRRIEALTARLLEPEGAEGGLRYRVSVKLSPVQVERAQISGEGVAALISVKGGVQVDLAPRGQ